MPEFEASIKASWLKHAISVLRRLDDESVFEVCDGEISSRAVSAENTTIVQVTIADKITVSEPHKVGIDLDKVSNILRMAYATDTIDISEFADDTWFFKHGIHQRSMRLIEPTKLRKIPNNLIHTHTAAVILSGKEFKDICKASAYTGVNWILFRATADEMVLNNVGDEIHPDTYVATLPKDRFKLQPREDEIVTALYSVDLLQDIAADMRVKDEVVLQFATDCPCEIQYERDGVKVEFMLAPRIESE